MPKYTCVPCTTFSTLSPWTTSCFSRLLTRGRTGLGRQVFYMLRQYLLGSAISICNITIHALVMASIIKVTQILEEMTASRQTFRLIAIMIATVSVLMVAHFAEVLVWSLAYAIASVAPAGTDLVYFAFVNYTTLGYGDVTPVERWHLLGPMTAMNGVLLFGWSTAVIFEVLLKTLESQRTGA